MVDKSKSVTVDLEFPIEHDGRDIKSLTFRRMKAKDALAGEGESNEVRAGYAMFAALAGVSIDVILELDVADLETIGEKIAPLMGKNGAEALANLKARDSAGETS